MGTKYSRNILPPAPQTGLSTPLIRIVIIVTLKLWSFTGGEAKVVVELSLKLKDLLYKLCCTESSFFQKLLYSLNFNIMMTTSQVAQFDVGLETSLNEDQSA